ncbi:MAG: hypothetical protein ACXU86_14590, partial [Archangium sp.]
MSVVIEGENFLALATQHIGGREPVTVDSGFEAFLDEVALEDVTLEDSHTLHARVPEGLVPGWHSLAVVGPLGRRVELPRAYFSSDRPLALLGARAELQQDHVSVGQRTRLLLTVENTGGTAALAVSALLHPAGEGQVEVIPELPSADIAPGGSVSLSWALEAAAPGDARFSLEVRGTESTTGVEVLAPSVEVGPLQIRNRAVLTPSLTASPPVVNVGQQVTLSLHVTNPGEVAVRGLVPDEPGVTTGRATLVSGPVPPSVDLLPAGGSRDFQWKYVADTQGALSFQAGAGGFDDFSGVEVRAPEARSAEVTVQLPGALEARFTRMPANVDVGQEFDAELEVTNTGDSTVLGVKLEAVSSSGAGQVTLLSGPVASADIPGRTSVVFRGHLRGAAEGSCVFHAGAGGVDATDGARVTALPVDSAPLTIQRPAALSATLSAPIRVRPGSSFGVSLTVTNTGSASA